MDTDSLSTPLLTVEQVMQWVQERSQLVERLQQLQDELAGVDRRLDAVALLLPKEAVERLLGDRSPASRSPETTKRVPGIPNNQIFRRNTDGSLPVTQICMDLLAAENGGRTPKWLRERIMTMPDQKAKMTASAGVNNALARLVARKYLVKRGSLYYHADVLKRIEAGEVVEEQGENCDQFNFSAEMLRVFTELGGRGTAGDVVSAARLDSATGPSVNETPNNVYRWLGKQLLRGSLLKDGDQYHLPGVPVAGGATLPFGDNSEGGADVS